jgi:diguanylate cyclase (GGDEF)-like protein
MAATDSYDNPLERSADTSPAAELLARLQEEISRAERQQTALSCLLVGLDRERLHDEQGQQISEQALSYMASALARQLRRFDRVGRLSEQELLVLLPGADGSRAEIVARRALNRLRAVKVELNGQRHPIGVAIGLGTWNTGVSAAQLLERTRLLVRSEPPHTMPTA